MKTKKEEIDHIKVVGSVNSDPIIDSVPVDHKHPTLNNLLTSSDMRQLKNITTTNLTQKQNCEYCDKLPENLKFLLCHALEFENPSSFECFQYLFGTFGRKLTVRWSRVQPCHY